MRFWGASPPRQPLLRGLLLLLLMVHPHTARLLLTTHPELDGPLVPPVSGDVDGVGENLHSGSGRYRRRTFPGPQFHPLSPTNVSSQLKANAYLPCRIKGLGNKSVSWIRNRDQHILTIDRYTFIADERFAAWHDPYTQTWTLHIKFVQDRDAGSYECQISTEPKMSHFVELSVIAPTVSISGESDIYVKSGSIVDIQCVIRDALEEPTYIFWFQGKRRVVGRDPRISLMVNRVPPDTSIGTFSISSAKLRDSGNYTCAPESLERASVMLHVLKDEEPAAMQDTASTSASPALLTTSLLYLTITCIAIYFTKRTPGDLT